MKSLHALCLYIFLIWSLHSQTSAQTGVVESYTLRVGTIERIAPPGAGWIFRCEAGEEEVFGHKESILTASGIGFRPLPNLQEIGFRLENDSCFYYETEQGKRSPYQAAAEASSKYPGIKVKSMLFRGLAKIALELPMNGRVSVIRADFTIDGNQRTLWSFRSAK